MCDPDDFASCGTPGADDPNVQAASYSQRRCQLPRRRVPVAATTSVRRSRRGFWGIEDQYRHRARHLHRRHQRAAHPACQRLGGGVYWRDAELADAASILLHAFAQNDIAVIARDADSGLQSAEGRGQLQHADARTTIRSASRETDGRHCRQQSAQRKHPQLGVLHQGRGVDAGHRCQGVRELQVLIGVSRGLAAPTSTPSLRGALATKQSKFFFLCGEIGLLRLRSQ